MPGTAQGPGDSVAKAATAPRPGIHSQNTAARRHTCIKTPRRTSRSPHEEAGPASPSSRCIHLPRGADWTRLGHPWNKEGANSRAKAWKGQ